MKAYKFSILFAAIIIGYITSNSQAQLTPKLSKNTGNTSNQLDYFIETIKKLNTILEQQKVLIEKQSQVLATAFLRDSIKSKITTPKFKIGLSLNAFRSPTTLQYRLLGNSSPSPDTILPQMGIGVNAILLWDFSDKYSLVLSVPIVQSFLAFNAQSVGAKQSPIGIGVARSFWYKKREIFRIGALLTFSQYIIIPENKIDCRCFPISLYSSLVVGEKIPDDILSKRFNDTRVIFSPNISVIFPIKEL